MPLMSEQPQGNSDNGASLSTDGDWLVRVAKRNFVTNANEKSFDISFSPRTIADREEGTIGLGNSVICLLKRFPVSWVAGPDVLQHHFVNANGDRGEPRFAGAPFHVIRKLERSRHMQR
jgi:hypothetical protein